MALPHSGLSSSILLRSILPINIDRGIETETSTNRQIVKKYSVSSFVLEHHGNHSRLERRFIVDKRKTASKALHRGQ